MVIPPHNAAIIVLAGNLFEITLVIVFVIVANVEGETTFPNRVLTVSAIVVGLSAFFVAEKMFD